MNRKLEEAKKRTLNPFLEDDACVGKRFTVSPMNAEGLKKDGCYDVYGSHGQILYMIGESVKVTGIDKDRKMVVMCNKQNTEGWENFEIPFAQFQRDFGAWPPVDLEANEEWIVTDPDCLQCCKIISEVERIYEFVQINDYSDMGFGCRAARGRICLGDYSEKEIQDNLHFFGYDSMSDFEQQNGGIIWCLIAEMVFETNAASYETVGALDTRFSFAEMGAQIEQMTGMELKEYYQK